MLEKLSDYLRIGRKRKLTPVFPWVNNIRRAMLEQGVDIGPMTVEGARVECCRIFDLPADTRLSEIVRMYAR